ERGEQQQREQLEGPHPGREDLPGQLLAPTGTDLRRTRGRQEDEGEQGCRAGADEGREQPVATGGGVLAARADRCPGEHERDDDEHDDGADVDEHLHEGDELGPEDEVAAGEPEQGDDEPECGVDHLTGGDGQGGGGRGDDAGGGEGEVETGHVPPSRGAAGPPRAGLSRAVTSGGSAAAWSSSGGAGTSSAHCPRRSFSWTMSRMSVSAYSNCGLQKRASKGQTSTQIPQYMHSEKSIAKRSRTLRCRARPPSVVGGTSSLCESM